MTRSPEALLQLVEGIDVANNFAFLPHRRATAAADDGWEVTPMLTLCNVYVAVCTAALGCPIPAKLANKQHAWLSSTQGRLAGWLLVDSETARKRVQGGFPTVAAEVRPGHGHIALVVPTEAGHPMGLFVSAAGVQNFVRCPLHRSFGAAAKPDFFTHN